MGHVNIYIISNQVFFLLTFGVPRGIAQTIHDNLNVVLWAFNVHQTATSYAHRNSLRCPPFLIIS